MASYCKITLVGHLGKDVELRTTENGQQVANFSMAVSEKRGNEEKTTWFRIAAWGKNADVANRFLKKGSACMVTGRLSAREYQTNAGATGFALEVTCDDLVLLGGQNQDQQPAQESAQQTGGGTLPQRPAQPVAQGNNWQVPDYGGSVVPGGAEEPSELPF